MKAQKKMVIKNKVFELSYIPKKVKIFPIIGMELTLLFKAIIDMNGTIAAIEKDSKKPLIICKKIKK